MTAAAIPTLRTPPLRYPQALAVCVSVYFLIALGRAHEIIPQLQPLRLGILGALVTAGMAFRYFRRADFAALLSTTPGKGLVIATAFAALTIPTGIWPSASFNYLSKIHYNALLVFTCAALAFMDRRTMRWIVLALVIDVMLAGAASIRAPAGRFEIGDTYDANETAAFFVMCIPWGIYLFLTEKGWPRWVGIASIPLCVIGVLKTGSRGGLLGVGALLPFLIYLSPPKRRGPFIMAVIGGGLATTLAMGEQTTYRLMKAFDTEEYNYTTEDGRVEVWKRGLGYIAAAPLHGVGMDGFGYKELASKSDKGFGVRQTAAHNMYIQVAAELGLIGFTGFMMMLLGGLQIAGKVRVRMGRLFAEQRDPEAFREMLRAGMAQLSLYSVMCTGFFLSLGYSSMLYFTVGAACGQWLGNRSFGSGPGGPAPQAAPARRPVRGMRGWRTARPVAAAGMPASRAVQS
ncbi:MAG: O-antigen ligase family protein [Gemmatimonadetes bacterium]|nr:O-antigen ligase family protein [Gemmatimonadota bacterium]